MLTIVLVFPPFRKAFFSISPRSAKDVSVLARHRLIWVDAVRGIAIIAVIIIHVTYMFRFDVRGTDIIVNDILNNIFRFAVPVFFITAGMLQPSVPMEWRAIGTYYRHRLVTLVVPYTLVCIVIIFVQGIDTGEALALWGSGGISPPYWFVVVLFQLYLLYPFLQRFARRRYAAAFSFIFSYICYQLWWNWIGVVPIFPRFLFFFVWGMSMRQVCLSSRMTATSLSPWIGIVFTYLIVTFSFPVHQYNARYLYGTAMFIILAVLCQRGRKSAWVHGLASVGRRSLWIYLTHFFIVQYIYEYLPLDRMSYDFSVASMVFLTVPICIALAVLVDRIYRYCLIRR